jgi:hypothetical protein
MLQPMLLAHVGPTVTNFDGAPTTLDPQSPVESILIGAKVYAAARIVPGNGCNEFAIRALDRMRRALEYRPVTLPRPSEPTSRVLARLEMSLATGDRAGAVEYLELLRSELRIDALNQHFIEVRIFATFRDWQGLVNVDWFGELCVVRKPAAVAGAMLDALWNVHLADVADDPNRLAIKYREAVRPFAMPLLAQALIEPGSLADRMRSLEGPEAGPNLPPAAAAQDLLERAVEAPSTVKLSEALEAIEDLSVKDRETLIESGVGQRALADIGPLERPVPTGWVEWLNVLPDPNFSQAVSTAREAADLWLAASIESSEEAAKIAEGLLRVGLSDGIGQLRLADSLPSLVRWVKSDPHYPRRELREVYVALLQLFTLLEHRSGAERDAATDLLEAILSLGTNVGSYRRVLADFASLVDEGAGEASIYWLIDVASTVLQQPAPDPDARLALLNKALSSFQPLARLLSPGQRAAYNRVAIGASWPALPAIAESVSRQSLQSLQGKTIAIYTLTESAARQAEAALKEIEPSLNIALAHDHVASQRLTRLSRDADLFVVTASSAKHAATDCILANRGDLPILYASGRGFSSIVRTVEEYATREAITLH